MHDVKEPRILTEGHFGGAASDPRIPTEGHFGEELGPARTGTSDNRTLRVFFVRVPDSEVLSRQGLRAYAAAPKCLGRISLGFFRRGLTLMLASAHDCPQTTGANRLNIN